MAAPHDDRPAPRWRPTRALRRAVGVVAVSLLAALVLGAIELVLLAVPFALGTALSLAKRPTGVPESSMSLDQPTSVEGGAANARVVVGNHDPDPLLCVVNARVSKWIRLRHGAGQYAALVRPAGSTVVRLTGRASRWGPQHIGPASVWMYACDGLLAAAQRVLPAAPLAVYPASDMFDTDEMLPRAAGVSGIHRTRRAGESGELADVRLFRAGDRLRRINWRVTQRSGEIHVNATQSERDAHVLLVLDARQEAGTSGGVHGVASVLDTTVRAAAAIAGHYTHQGDQVALVEFGSGLRRLRPGTGRRHYLAALEWLVRVNHGSIGYSPNSRLLAALVQPPSACVMVLTPLLDVDSARMLAVLARTGRSLVAVDTLSPSVSPDHELPWSPQGERLWRLERENTIHLLRGVGVPVERWQGPGSLDSVLRHVYRVATSFRVPR